MAPGNRVIIARVASPPTSWCIVQTSLTKKYVVGVICSMLFEGCADDFHVNLYLCWQGAIGATRKCHKKYCATCIRKYYSDEEDLVIYGEDAEHDWLCPCCRQV